MKVKELCDVLSPFQMIQVGDSKTGEPITSMDYLADSTCEVYDSYGNYDVYGIAPKIDKDGKPYLVILVELKV